MRPQRTYGCSISVRTPRSGQTCPSSTQTYYSRHASGPPRILQQHCCPCAPLSKRLLLGPDERRSLGALGLTGLKQEVASLGAVHVYIRAAWCEPLKYTNKNSGSADSTHKRHKRLLRAPAIICEEAPGRPVGGGGGAALEGAQFATVFLAIWRKFSTPPPPFQNPGSAPAPPRSWNPRSATLKM